MIQNGRRDNVVSYAKITKNTLLYLVKLNQIDFFFDE